MNQALERARRMREQAEGVVRELESGLAECEATLASEKRSDVVRRVKGKSSLDQAIEDARRMVEVLKRAEAELIEGGAVSGGGAEDSKLGDGSTLAEGSTGGGMGEGLTGSGPTAMVETKPTWQEQRSEEETPLAGVIGRLGAGRAAAVVSGGFGRRATVLLGRH